MKTKKVTKPVVKPLPSIITILQVMATAMVTDVKDSVVAVSRTSTLVTATGTIVATDYTARGARAVANKAENLGDSVLAWTMKNYAKKVK